MSWATDGGSNASNDWKQLVDYAPCGLVEQLLKVMPRYLYCVQNGQRESRHLHNLCAHYHRSRQIILSQPKSNGLNGQSEVSRRTDWTIRSAAAILDQSGSSRCQYLAEARTLPANFGANTVRRFLTEYPEAPLVTLGNCICQWQNVTNTEGK